MPNYKKITVRSVSDPMNQYDRAVNSEKLDLFKSDLGDNWEVVSEEDLPGIDSPEKANTFDKFAAKGFKNPYENNDSESFGRGLIQGASFGWADELAGLVDPEWKQQMRVKDQLAQQGSPIAFGGGDILGSVPTSIAGGAIVGKGLKAAAPVSEVARRMINSPAAKAIVGGMAEGAIGGLGQSTEGNELSSTVIGAGAGALGGYYGNKLAKSLGIAPEQSFIPKKEIESVKDKFLKELTEGEVERQRKLIKPEQPDSIGILQKSEDLFGPEQIKQIDVSKKVDTNLEPFLPLNATGAVSIAGDKEITKNIISDKYLRDMADAEMRARMEAMRATKAEKQIKEFIYDNDFKTLSSNITSLESLVGRLKDNSLNKKPEDMLSAANMMLGNYLEDKSIPKPIKDRVKFLFNEMSKKDEFAPKERFNAFISRLNEEILTPKKELQKQVMDKIYGGSGWDPTGWAGKRAGVSAGKQIIEKKKTMPEMSKQFLKSPIEEMAAEDERARIEAIKYLIASGQLTEKDVK